MSTDLKYEQCLHDLAELLQVTSAVFQRIERRQSALTGFTSSQSFVLMTLFHAKRMSMGELAKKMDWEKSTLTRIVGIMSKSELLQQDKDLQDKRIVWLRLTEKGRQVWQKIKSEQRSLYSSIISALPKGHVREVMGSAQKLYEALEKAMDS